MMMAMKNKPKPDSGKKTWPFQTSPTNPFSLSQPHGKPNKVQVRQVVGRRSQRGR
jgi:hypothetical protein